MLDIDQKLQNKLAANKPNRHELKGLEEFVKSERLKAKFIKVKSTKK